MKTTHLLTAALFMGCLCMATTCDSCKLFEELSGMPPETQEGKNTFGFYVNGELYSSYRRPISFTFPSIDATYYRGTPETIAIYCTSNGENKDGPRAYIYMLLINPKENVELNLQEATVRLRFNIGSLTFRDTTIDKIILTRFDTINRIVSGRFSFELPIVDDYTSNVGDDYTFNSDSTARVTEGRFDLRLD
jgi:hypothetical protein